MGGMWVWFSMGSQTPPSQGAPLTRVWPLLQKQCEKIKKMTLE